MIKVITIFTISLCLTQATINRDEVLKRLGEAKQKILITGVAPVISARLQVKSEATAKLLYKGEEAEKCVKNLVPPYITRLTVISIKMVVPLYSKYSNLVEVVKGNITEENLKQISDDLEENGKLNQEMKNLILKLQNIDDQEIKKFQTDAQKC
ncbi:hypothetical protein O3M35_012250 [Rhynocoris fuscipes]|uniref:Uncharacterized protein n=1 Tax=Rhynocoris fuscipes TaxID=488301 RepID=A0AAW1CXH4_9HEMI